jgi:hypothetical protein
MTRTISFEYDPEHIPKLKDEIEVMMMQIKDEAYQKGIVAERERIIKLIRRVVSEHHSRKIQNVPSLLLIQLIEEGEQK